jgi:dienelactone hydrolase
MLPAALVVLGLAGAAPAAEPPDIEGRARALVEALAKKDFAAATKDFDDTMKKRSPADKLEAMWKDLERKLGDFRKPGAARREKAGKYDIVVIPVEFAKFTLDARVSFTADGQVTGLFLRAAEAPVKYEAPAYVNREAFRETEVKVGSGEWELPATLALPAGAGPFPAVVLVHGSGPNDRDETVLAAKPFRDLAWGLASQGVAVLRYEKRTKVYGKKVAADRTLTVKEEVVDDALEAVKLLRRQPAVDGKRVFVLGHSLGAMLAPRIGAADPEVAGLLLLAGATRPLEETIVRQTRYLASLGGPVSDEDKAELARVEAEAAKVKGLKAPAEGGDRVLGAFPAYWLALRACKPHEEAASLKLPMLVLQGERDYQVTMDDFALWQKALAEHPKATLKSYPKLNHLFAEGEGKSRPEEYNKPVHVAQEVVDDIARWVKDPARPRR